MPPESTIPLSPQITGILAFSAASAAVGMFSANRLSVGTYGCVYLADSLCGDGLNLIDVGGGILCSPSGRAPQRRLLPGPPAEWSYPLPRQYRIPTVFASGTSFTKRSACSSMGFISDVPGYVSARTSSLFTKPALTKSVTAVAQNGDLCGCLCGGLRSRRRYQPGIRSTLSLTNLVAMVAQLEISPCAFCTSIFSRLKPASTASIKNRRGRRQRNHCSVS